MPQVVLKVKWNCEGGICTLQCRILLPLNPPLSAIQSVREIKEKLTPLLKVLKASGTNKICTFTLTELDWLNNVMKNILLQLIFIASWRFLFPIIKSL